LATPQCRPQWAGNLGPNIQGVQPAAEIRSRVGSVLI